MINLLWLDGTWTGPGRRSAPSEALRHALNPDLVTFQYVDYAAAFGPATGLHDIAPAESVRQGVGTLEQAVRESPHRVIVGGYSQGAIVAIDFARDILPWHPNLIVDAVATMGDPHHLVVHGRSGIAGALQVPRPRLSVRAPGDPIADLPLGSPLRSVADVTEWMSIRTREARLHWVTNIIERLVEQQAQAWWAPWRWPDIASALHYADNYLRGGNHTLDYVTGGHAVRLARMIEEVS